MKTSIEEIAVKAATTMTTLVEELKLASVPILRMGIGELFAAGGVTQLSQGLGLDLPDTLPGHVKVLPDLLQGMIPAFPDAKAHFQDFFFPGSEGLENVLGGFHQVLVHRLIVGQVNFLIRD